MTEKMREQNRKNAELTGRNIEQNIFVDEEAARIGEEICADEQCQGARQRKPAELAA